MVTFRNCTEQTVMRRGDVLRFTFSAIGVQFGLPMFAYYLRTALATLHTDTGMTPIAAVSVPDGSLAATIDAMNGADYRTVGVATRAVQHTTEGNFVELSSVELLTPAKKAEATQPAGADARAATTTQQAKENADTSLTKKVTDFLANLGHAAQITVIVLVVVLALIYIPRGRK